MRGQENKKAIVMAAFGTTYPKALSSLISIQRVTQEKWPHIPVVLSFTSNMVRSCWSKRAGDNEFWRKNPEIPNDLAYIKSPLATLADMQNQGYRTIIVQPTHIAAGEEFHDLKKSVESLAGIRTIKDRWRPFQTLALGRPLLGTDGPEHPYLQDVEDLAGMLKPDIDLAAMEQSALIYVGHGNPYNCNGSYWDLMEVMAKMYPFVPVFIGCVEGQPSFDFVLRRLRHISCQRALIKPLMIVAGDHAANDMAGQQSGSLKSRLEAERLIVKPVLEGLGQNQEVAGKFVQHIQEAALENSIDLYEDLRIDQSISISFLSSKEIEMESFRRIEAETPKPIPFPEEQWPVVRRMIHTTADFDLLKKIVFHPQAVDQAMKTLQKGCFIHTDTEMARTGINKSVIERLGCQVRCRISDPEVVQMAKGKDITRSAAAVRLACEDLNDQIYVVGNAPTALIELVGLIKDKRCRPALVLGMPVGFVNASESKDLIQGQEEIPFIAIQGRKGGSALAASCINALAKMALSGIGE